MPLFYDMAVGAYHAGIRLAALFQPKAKAWVAGRKGLVERITTELREVEQPIWVHCSSLGEYEQGLPIIEGLQARYPKKTIVLTFFSPSGYEVVSPTSPMKVFYLPPDDRANARAFLNAVQPCMAIFVKYEFWYHYLQGLKERGIPTYLVSAIFRRSQPFFRWYGATHKRMLACFTKMFVQDEPSRDLLKKVGLNDVVVSGDTRFDRVSAIAAKKERSDVLEAFVEGAEHVLVAGSTWPKDEVLLADYFNDAQVGVKLVIAPHEVHQAHIEELVARFSTPVARWTTWSEADKDKLILVVDTIGVLSRTYRYGTVAYVGGGFDSGIHNVLEPAAFGLPVLFGPKHQKFKEARDLLEIGAAECVQDPKGFNLALSSLINDRAMLTRRSQLILDYVAENQGATRSIINQVVFSTRGGT